MDTFEKIRALLAEQLDIDPAKITMESDIMSDFEADSLDRLEGVMHAQRYTEARLYVREDTPFFTGPRVRLGEWAERQPRA